MNNDAMMIIAIIVLVMNTCLCVLQLIMFFFDILRLTILPRSPFSPSVFISPSSSLSLPIPRSPSFPTYPLPPSISLQLILCREYTRAEDQDWHRNHFCCFHCDIDLGGKQYRPQEGQPYCLKCYEIAFASVCEVRSATTIQLAFHCYGRGSTTNSPLPPPDMWQTRESRPASTAP